VRAALRPLLPTRWKGQQFAFSQARQTQHDIHRGDFSFTDGFLDEVSKQVKWNRAGPQRTIFMPIVKKDREDIGWEYLACGCSIVLSPIGSATLFSGRFERRKKRLVKSLRMRCNRKKWNRPLADLGAYAHDVWMISAGATRFSPCLR